jgi:hypothetical protein
MPAVLESDLLAGLSKLLPKPADSATREAKQKFSQRVSDAAAKVVAEGLRTRGMTGVAPSASGALAERRLAGGIGAKRVDVSWATESSGLLCGVSIKSINFRDARSKNFQKNLTNRRGDLLFESVTLHRRSPFAVLAAILILDDEAAHDFTTRRISTFETAQYHLRLFTGRRDPAGREEQFERIFIVLFNAGATSPSVTTYAVENLTTPASLDHGLDELVQLVAERNSDFYEVRLGRLKTRP